jgi:hypothetical protein
MKYFMGVDLARKKDWSVAVVIDSEGNVRKIDRFHQISWSLQCERVASLYRAFGCSKVCCDATGLGDVIIESLQAHDLTVEPFIFSGSSRKALVEELVLAFDNLELTIPDTEPFQVMKAELEAFEYSVDGVNVKYSAPPNGHDDCVFALALAVHAFHSERSAVWGVVQLLARRAQQIRDGVRDALGELVKPKPKLVVVPRISTVAKAAVQSEAPKAKANDPCKNPNCKSTSTVPLSGKLHCNQCGQDDGQPKPVLVGKCCNNFLPQICGGQVHCGSCGYDSGGSQVIGATKKLAENLGRGKHPWLGSVRWSA